MAKISKQDSKLDLSTQIAKFRFALPRNSSSYLTLFVLLIAGIFFARDIYIDSVIEGEGLAHILIEGAIFFVVLLALGTELKRVMVLSSSVSNSQEVITRLQKHLTDIIREEFDRWQFTKTEKKIALMLIKGYSMQNISDKRNVKEKSVRQQATGIYTKAGVSNRYELTSYFIEGLLEPEID